MNIRMNIKRVEKRQQVHRYEHEHTLRISYSTTATEMFGVLESFRKRERLTKIIKVKDYKQ